MILLRTNCIHILAQIVEVNRDALHNKLAGLGETVLQTDIAQEEHMCLSGHARPIVIPVEQVEGWWLFTQ